MSWPSGMPAWQEQDLQQLSTSGQLSGLNPLILAGIEKEETGGWSGGAVNPEGYGGYYGLSPNTTYPGNHVVSTQQEETGGAGSSPSPATQASYEAQSTTAAAEFASLLQKYNGSVAEAETAYQSGSYSGSYSPGVAVVLGVLNGTSAGSPSVSAGAGGAQLDNANTSQQMGVEISGFGGILQQIDNVLNPAQPGFLTDLSTLGTAPIGAVLLEIFSRLAFSAAFVGIIYIGFKTFQGQSGGGSSYGIGDLIDTMEKRRRDDLSQQRIDSRNAGTEQTAENVRTRTVSAERVAATPRVSQKYTEQHIHYHGAKEKANSKAKTAAKDIGNAIKVAL